MGWFKRADPNKPRGGTYPLNPLLTGVELHNFPGNEKPHWWTRNKVDETGDRFNDQFKLVWEKKNPPDPGTGVYAYETYGLPQYPVAGPSIRVRVPLSTYTPPSYYGVQLVPLAGIPTVAGQVIASPLYNRQQGFNKSIPTPVAMAPPNAIVNY
jgi:hypothetical protein